MTGEVQRGRDIPHNVTGHDSFVIVQDPLGRPHLGSALPRVVSITDLLWQAIAAGSRWAVIDGDRLTVRTVETVFVYLRVGGQTDGGRTIWVCEHAGNWPNRCTCTAGQDMSRRERHSLTCPEAATDVHPDPADAMIFEYYTSQRNKGPEATN